VTTIAPVDDAGLLALGFESARSDGKGHAEVIALFDAAAGQVARPPWRHKWPFVYTGVQTLYTIYTMYTAYNIILSDSL
jgi:hypothetical protein